jgi:hypothetical protein
MKYGKIFLPLLAIIMVLPLAACGVKEPANQEELQALLVESADALKAVEYMKTSGTGSFTVNLYDMEGMDEVTGMFAEGITGEITIDTAHNMVDNELEMKMRADVDMGELLSGGIIMEVWQAGGWQYLHFQIPVLGERWMKTQQLNEQIMKISTSAMDIYKRVLTRVDLEYIGLENVRAKSNYRIKMRPTGAALNALIDWVAELVGQEASEALEDETFMRVMNILMDGLVCETWIDTTTKLPSQITIVLDVEFSADDIEPGSTEPGTIKLNFNITQNYTDYNKAFSITVPQEALDAEEISPEDMGFPF